MIYSTLTTSFLLFVFGVFWQENTASAVFEQHTSLTTMASWYALLALIIGHSLLFNMVSWLYIKKGSAWVDGVRIGVITGLFLSLFFGFQLMLNVSVLPLNFLENHVVNLSGLVFMFYVVSGTAQGFIFHALMKRKKHKRDENNIYPCRMDDIKEPTIKGTLQSAT